MKIFSLLRIMTLVVSLPILGLAQEVRMSENFNIRADDAFEVLTNIGDEILLYRRDGSKQKFSSLDHDLKKNWDRELELEEERVRVYGLVSKDTSFTMIYGFKEEGVEKIRIKEFDQELNPIDTNLIIKGKEKIINRVFGFKLSEDRSKSLLYGFEKNKHLIIRVINNENNTLFWEETYNFEDVDLVNDLVEIIVSDHGEVILFLDKKNRKYSRKNHQGELVIFRPNSNEGLSTLIDFKGKLNNDVLFSFENKNYHLAIVGLYSENGNNTSDGYFYFSKSMNKLRDVEVPAFKVFDKSFLEEAYGDKVKNKKGLESFRVVDFVWRRDGGFLFFCEMHKEFARRTNFVNTSGGGGNFNRRGWRDYYDEDIAIFAIHPSGEEHWKKVLQKKQFSQDDEGVFSSFNIIKTPSRLRLIYNDEISKSSTVSEYILDPLGNSKRQNVLNTEYQNLRLRFRDAVQINNSEILVPSQSAYELSLVKISY